MSRSPSRSPSSRAAFRGSVTSPFLLHQFAETGDRILPSLREAAATLCRNADRETLIRVIEILQKSDPRAASPPPPPPPPQVSSSYEPPRDSPMIRRSMSQPALKPKMPCRKESASSAMLRELAHAPAAVKLGLDLGGSLTKLVIATTSVHCKAATDERLRLEIPEGYLHFASTSTGELEEVVKALPLVVEAPRRIVAAGGGAHKLRGSFLALGIELTPFREMQSIVDGLLLLHELQVEDEIFRVRVGEDKVPVEFAAHWPKPLLPLLLVNVGSGVSCLLVTREGYRRIGGTAIGGATFLGLARALTAARTFEEAIRLAKGGESMHVDTLVEDIYGRSGCADLGLPPDLTAASFGKLARDSARYSDADLCRALLEMVAQSCCVLARAHAAQLGCRQRVFFAGGFVDNNPLARATIANSLRSLGGRAHFLKHSDFLGALGATARCLSTTGGSRRNLTQLGDDDVHPPPKSP
ncbi:hypothetical protein CTAYLR_003837 [Chrysophaeum taylorii]|uniref:Pantothenate kinase n=1 Tax=Chrysophaeum taylorii TaxID=2483200 RepID=A0AAD7UDN7_9STRA|nr:hypothetical protein CTAYLR_003837 [Chrysophaeum taylorii]